MLDISPNNNLTHVLEICNTEKSLTVIRKGKGCVLPTRFFSSYHGDLQVFLFFERGPSNISSHTGRSSCIKGFCPVHLLDGILCACSR